MVYESESVFLQKDLNNFNTLVKKANDIKKLSDDLTISKDEVKNIRMNNELQLEFKSDQFKENVTTNLSKTAFGQVCNKIHVPLRYMNQCIETERFDLVQDNMNSWLKELECNGILARLYNGKNMRGFLSNSYSVFDSNEILDVIPNEIDMDKYSIKGYLLNEERFHLRLVGKEPIGTKNDKDLYVGIVIDSSDVGTNTLTVRYLIYKQVCSNGLILPLRGKDNKNISANLLSQIHRGIEKDKFQEAFILAISQVDDMTDDIIKQIDKSDEIEIPYFKTIEKYDKFVEKIQGKTNLPKSIIDSAIEAMDANYNHTNWGLINGFTEVAQDKSFEMRIQIETVATSLFNIKA